MSTETLVPPRTEPYTLQELFDIAWQRFVVEKRPKSDRRIDGGFASCLYRNGDNCCIFGWSIPDDRYSDAWEGDVADAIARYMPDLYGGISAMDLLDLQACHDSAHRNDFHAEVESRLRNYALGRSLSILGEAQS